MKKIYHISLIMIVAVIAMSCTRNNGDIGEYFGTWKLESMTVNGELDGEYGGDIFWKFQSSVFCMEQVNERHDTENRWGTWEDDGKVLRLNFTHHDDAHPEGASIYSPFPVTRISNGISELAIMSMDEAQMGLQYIDSVGSVIVYKLKKW